MSGSLLSLFDELFDASFRGIPFHMPDVREETGRRVVRFLFPGRDEAWHEDLGAFDGPIRVVGVIVGDDYIRQAQALRAAFRTPGPGLLSHPWLGDVDVILAEPAEIALTQGELRAARFVASFEPWVRREPPTLGTFGGLLGALDSVRAGARRILAFVLAPVRLTVAAIGAVSGFALGMVTLFRRSVAAASGLRALPYELEASYTGLLALGRAPADSGYAGAVSLALAAPSGALAASAAAAPATAVAAFEAGPAAPLLAPAAAAAVLLDASAALLDEPAALPGLPLAASALVLADAVALGAQAPFASRQEAYAMRDRLDAGLARLAAAAARQATLNPAGVGALWREVQAARGALARDLTERGGRLPAVATLRLPAEAPTWLVAQHLDGDSPGRLVARYLDLVARNRPRRPARLEGDVEVLG